MLPRRIAAIAERRPSARGDGARPLPPRRRSRAKTGRESHLPLLLGPGRQASQAARWQQDLGPRASPDRLPEMALLAFDFSHDLLGTTPALPGQAGQQVARPQSSRCGSPACRAQRAVGTSQGRAAAMRTVARWYVDRGAGAATGPGSGSPRAGDVGRRASGNGLRRLYRTVAIHTGPAGG